MKLEEANRKAKEKRDKLFKDYEERKCWYNRCEFIISSKVECDNCDAPLHLHHVTDRQGYTDQPRLRKSGVHCPKCEFTGLLWRVENT